MGGGFLRTSREWISGFHDRLRQRPSSLFMLFGCTPISVATLINRSMYGGQDLGVLELDTMSPADAMFIYDRFVWMSQTNVPMMLLDPGINRTASLPNVNLTTFAGYAVHACSIPLSSSMDCPPSAMCPLPRLSLSGLSSILQLSV
jgi:hypothetical protein